ncbi:MAG: hypothetical protein H0W08_22540 [Acidobacteria bacterium]|nr:hypothetical protein [Acidobacteriota bacterium]
MSKIGYGYGSEWHLLSYLGRHRSELNDRIQATTGARRVDWLDFPTQHPDRGRIDAEWKGLDFLNDPVIQTEWREIWPHRAGVQNWDAVARIDVDGRDERLLVEAKGHCGEIASNCAAKVEGGLNQIRAALEATKRALGVDASHDWLNGYYQFCNRLAVLQFLASHNIRAHLLFVYFTGDFTAGRDCPKDEVGWQSAIKAQDERIGLPAQHPLRERVHKLFLPVFIDLYEPSGSLHDPASQS